MGLSFREYLALSQPIDLPNYTLSNLLSETQDVFLQFLESFKPYSFFQEYLQEGYYPFLLDQKDTAYQRLNQLIRQIIEVDLAELDGFDSKNARKLLHLLTVISYSVPFKPNISELANKTGIHRNTIPNYFVYLEQARLIHLLYPSILTTAALQKPEKIYLNNPTLAFALSSNPDMGNLRETFALCMLKENCIVSQSKISDFLVDERYMFEIGVKNKSNKQLKDTQQAWRIVDNQAAPISNKIPLWMLGFLFNKKIGLKILND